MIATRGGKVGKGRLGRAELPGGTCTQLSSPTSLALAGPLWKHIPLGKYLPGLGSSVCRHRLREKKAFQSEGNQAGSLGLYLMEWDACNEQHCPACRRRRRGTANARRKEGSSSPVDYLQAAHRDCGSVSPLLARQHGRLTKCGRTSWLVARS